MSSEKDIRIESYRLSIIIAIYHSYEKKNPYAENTNSAAIEYSIKYDHFLFSTRKQQIYLIYDRHAY